jgi:hypothetical protein
MHRFLFDCPFVRPQLPRLARRHVGFLAVLFVLQTGVLRLRTVLSPSWFAPTGPKGSSPFEIALEILCFALALAEIANIRSILDRAHPPVQLRPIRVLGLLE